MFLPPWGRWGREASREEPPGLSPQNHLWAFIPQGATSAHSLLSPKPGPSSAAGVGGAVSFLPGLAPGACLTPPGVPGLPPPHPPAGPTQIPTPPSGPRP